MNRFTYGGSNILGGAVDEVAYKTRETWQFAIKTFGETYITDRGGIDDTPFLYAVSPYGRFWFTECDVYPDPMDPEMLKRADALLFCGITQLFAQKCGGPGANGVGVCLEPLTWFFPEHGPNAHLLFRKFRKAWDPYNLYIAGRQVYTKEEYDAFPQPVVDLINQMKTEPSGGSRLRGDPFSMHTRISGFVCAALLCLLGLPASAEVAGSMVIAGHGPEQRVIESLAHAFEKANPRAYIDVVWDDNSKPLDLVKTKQAKIAVTGAAEDGFRSFQIAWDGIAIMVHRSNFTKEVTKQEVAELFSGKYKVWADLGGPDTKVLLIDRPRNENNRDAFEQQLGIAGKIPEDAKVIAKDEKVIKTIAALPKKTALASASSANDPSASSSNAICRKNPAPSARRKAS